MFKYLIRKFFSSKNKMSFSLAGVTAEGNLAVVLAFALVLIGLALAVFR